MIRSLFDTEDSSEEEKKQADDKVEPEPAAPPQAETPANIEPAEKTGIPVHAEFDLDPQQNSILELEPVAAETDEEFLELEKKLKQIEEEVRADQTTAFDETVSDRDEASIETPILSAMDKIRKSETHQSVPGSTAPPEDRIAAENEEPAIVRTERQPAPADSEYIYQPDQPEAVPPVMDLSPAVRTPPPLSDETTVQPESKAEIIRRSGLAWTAATVLFGSVAFLLVLGWFADLLLGTSPWGVIGGIVVGSILGFFQFFRLTSQILKDK